MFRFAVCRSWIGVGVLCLLWTGCVGDFVARRIDPLKEAKTEFAASPNETLLAGMEAQRRRSDEATVLYARTLENLAANSAITAEDEARRFATSRLVELSAPKLLANPAPLIAGPYRIILRAAGDSSGVEPSRFVKLEPADRYQASRVAIKGSRPGLGAPLVGQLKPSLPFRENGKWARPITGLRWSVTAVPVVGPLRNGVREIALELHEPHHAATVSSDGNRTPLAADFTTPLAVAHSSLKSRNFAYGGFFHGDRIFSNAGLYPLELPSTEKTPVIFVHGLISDPAVFRYMINALAADPEINRRYQFWVFFYPTGLPVPATAAILRESLADQLHQLDPNSRHPALHRAVLVGHSMGGLVSRLVISDSDGEKFHQPYFRQSLDQLTMSDEMRTTLRRAFVFHPSPDVRTTIFIATPHRGSSLAVSPLGSIARLLAGLPEKMTASVIQLATQNKEALAGSKLGDENSIFGLRPTSPLAEGLAAAKLNKEVRCFSIIGDRGRSGPLARSSDGVVPYASAHLPEAREEIVVPANHLGSLMVPEALEAVARILRERAGSRP